MPASHACRQGAAFDYDTIASNQMQALGTDDLIEIATVGSLTVNAEYLCRISVAWRATDFN